MNPPGWSIRNSFRRYVKSHGPANGRPRETAVTFLGCSACRLFRSPCSSSFRSPQPMEPARKDPLFEVKQFPAGNGPRRGSLSTAFRRVQASFRGNLADCLSPCPDQKSDELWSSFAKFDVLALFHGMALGKPTLVERNRTLIAVDCQKLFLSKWNPRDLGSL